MLKIGDGFWLEEKSLGRVEEGLKRAVLASPKQLSFFFCNILLLLNKLKKYQLCCVKIKPMPKNVSFDSQPKTKDKEKAKESWLKNLFFSLLLFLVLLTMWGMFFVSVMELLTWLIGFLIPTLLSGFYENFYVNTWRLFSKIFNFLESSAFLFALFLVSLFLTYKTKKYLENKVKITKELLKVGENKNEELYKSSLVFRVSSNTVFVLFVWVLLSVFGVMTILVVFILLDNIGMEVSYLAEKPVSTIMVALALIFSLIVRKWWKKYLGFSLRQIYIFALFLSLVILSFSSKIVHTLPPLENCRTKLNVFMDNVLHDWYSLSFFSLLLSFLALILLKKKKPIKIINIFLGIIFCLSLVSILWAAISLGEVKSDPVCMESMPRDPNDFADF